jgi:hypothetical protein
MHRLAMALLLACLVAPAAGADAGDAWWAEAEPQAEPDYGWWHAAGDDVALEAAPQEPPPALASAAFPLARQSVPSFGAPKTGPGCNADTGVCDEAPTEGDGEARREPAGADGAALPADGEEAEDGEDVDALGSGSDAAAAAATDEDDDEAPHNCNRYAKQITRYQADLAYVNAQGNDLAARALEAQIGRLMAQMDRRCPLPPPKNQLAAMLRTLKKLGKLALTAAKYGLL